MVNKYKINNLVGIGGMCKVYRATDEKLDRYVALKILNEELAKDNRERERFLREAKNCANLHHKNIVSVFDTGIFNDNPFIAMEFVEGTNLEKLLEKKQPLPQLLDIIKEITKALEFAHEKGVIHRDLKPANILISKDEIVKVADWGLSKTSKDKANLTRTGMVLGTPQYMAPEQIISNDCSPQSDPS